MRAHHVELVAHGLRTAADVAHVGVLRDESQRALLAASTDHDRRTAGPQRLGNIARVGRLVVAALEGRTFVAQHSATDLHGLLQPVETFARAREVEAVADVLDVVPRGADAEDGPAVRDHVERRDHLGEECRIAIRDSGDECAELYPLGTRGQSPE